jgi:hypothetical protein
MSDAADGSAALSPGARQQADVYHRERAIAERRAASRASNVWARAAHLELAYQHELAQAIAWHRADIAFDPATALAAVSESLRRGWFADSAPNADADQTPRQASGGVRSAAA